MSFRTNALKVQAFAGAVYGIQVGTTTMAQINADITSAGGLTNALNGYYTSSFGSVANATVATSIATNLGLTGDALASGAAYITAQLNAAAPAARGAVISNILDLFAGLTADATFGAAATAYNAKVDAATAYTGTANVAIGSTAGTGSTFTLTTGADNVPGTANNDTINGYINFTTAAQAASTLNAADVINGGSGVDTLKVVIDGAVDDGTSGTSAAVALNIGDVSGVEKISLRNITTEAATNLGHLTLALPAGVQEVILDRSTAPKTAITSLAAGAALTINGDASATNGVATFTYATGTSPVTLNLTNGVKQTAAAAAISSTSTATTATINSTGAANVAGQIALSGAKLTSVTINASSDLKVTDGTTGAGISGFDSASAAATLTIKGAGAVDIEDLDSNVDAVVASDNTGGVTLGLTAGAQTFVGGSGKDVVTLGAALSGAIGQVDAGAGTSDTVVETSATNYTGNMTRIAGFEILRIKKADGGSFDTSKAQAAGITSYELDTVTSNNAVLTKLQADAAIKINANVTATTLTLATATGSADALNVTVNAADAASAGTTVSGLNITGVETLNLVSSATKAGTNANVLSTLLGTDNSALRTVNISGANAFTLTKVGALVQNLTLDGSSATGILTIAGTDATGNLTIKGGSGADVLAGSSATDNISGGAGKDQITYTAGGDTLNGDAGDDTIIFQNSGTTTITVANLTSVNGGDGIDTLSIPGDSTNSALVDFTGTGVTISGIEKLTFGIATDAKFTGSQVTGTAWQVDASATSGTNTIEVVASNGGTVDLSGWVFTNVGNNWASADTITITGSSGYDTLTAAAKATKIVGGAGQDVMTGGAGADVFDYTGIVTSTTVTSGVDTEANQAFINEGSDTIIGFVTAAAVAADATKVADKLHFSLADLNNLNGSVSSTTLTPATDFAASSNVIASGDFVVFGATTALAADSGNGGRFIFNKVTGDLILDVGGNTTATATASPVYGGTTSDDIVIARLVGVTDLAAADLYIAS